MDVEQDEYSDNSNHMHPVVFIRWVAYDIRLYSKRLSAEVRCGMDIPTRLAALIDVKTIVTLSLVVASIFLAIMGKIDPMEISRMASIAIAFYFGVKKEQYKKEAKYEIQ